MQVSSPLQSNFHKLDQENPCYSIFLDSVLSLFVLGEQVEMGKVLTSSVKRKETSGE